MESVKKFEVVWDGEIIFMVSQSDFDRETTGLEQRRYAEQPAPVAVVLPGPASAQDFGDESMANGWNACLDEVARLNSETKP